MFFALRKINKLVYHLLRLISLICSYTLSRYVDATIERRYAMSQAPNVITFSRAILKHLGECSYSIPYSQ